MKTDYVKKGLTIGIIVLFIGSNVVSGFNIQLKNTTYPLSSNNGNTLYVGESRSNNYNKNALKNNLFSHYLNPNKLLIGCNVEEGYYINIGYSVCNTNDNGYIVCGFTSRLGCTGGFLVKTDSQGYESWNKTYFIKLDTMFSSVEQVSDGGYIVTGFTYDSWNDSNVIFLLKTDEQGNKIWDKTYDSFKETICTAVKKTDDGGYIISGIINNYQVHNSSVLLIKTDSYGTMTWFKTFEFNYEIPWVDVQQITDGGYIVGGTIRNSYGDSLAFLFKTDENANEIWNKSYFIMDHNYGYSVIQVNDGGFVIVGYTGQSLFEDLYAMLIKTDDNGVEEWNKTYEDSAGFSVEQTSDNGFIIGGASFIEDKVYGLLLKTDLYGNKIWNKTYSDLEEAECIDVKKTQDEGYILTGISLSLLNPNITYALLLKTNNSGNEQWYRYFDFSAAINPSFVKFYGWDVDNSVYKLFINIRHYSMGHQSSSPIGYYETKEIGVLPGGYFYLISWYGKEGNCSVNGYVDVSEGEHKEILQNLTFCDDLPNIDIVKPKNKIYINNKSIIPFFFPIIIGNIELEVNASDFSSGIDYVEIYIDNKLVFNHSTGPYNLQWNKWAFGKHNIKAVAVDKVGYKESDEITVWKFF